jgi:hypothetical protein
VKRIKLLSLPDPRFPVGDPEYEANRVDYASIIEQCIRVPLDRSTGATIDEMRKGIRVLDALDARVGDVIQLEDADWEFLKQKVEKMPWGMTDRRLVRFYDDVFSATESPRDTARSDGVASAA